MSPRTPVIPLVLALALWAVGLASSSRALERSAAAPPAATWLHDAPAHPADGAALAVDLLAAGDAVTPAEARRGTGESLEGPISADAPGGREAGPPPAHTARPAHGRSPGPLYLHKRSLRC